MRPHGRARISASKPQAQAVCDRCGFRFPHKELQWQFDWVGARLQNLRILVCPNGCYDKPQENVRTIVLPPDPTPIMNPRPEAFVSDNSPLSGIGWDPARAVSGVVRSSLSQLTAFYGTLSANGGVDAAFFGGAAKKLSAAAVARVSVNSSTANQIGVNWSATPQPANPDAGFGPVQQSYTVSGATVTAPSDAAFLGTNLGTTVSLFGSSDGATLNLLASSTTAGLQGEVITLASAVATPYPYHLVSVAGDGVHTAAVALVQLSVSGQSAAATGSELGA